jgi:hypothetical protein
VTPESSIRASSNQWRRGRIRQASALPGWIQVCVPGDGTAGLHLVLIAGFDKKSSKNLCLEAHPRNQTILANVS